MRSDFVPVIRALDKAFYRQQRLFRQGPQMIITHRLWMRGSRCMPGEEVLSVEVHLRGRDYHLPCSHQLRLMIDYLARQRLGQSAAQLAVGINSHPFYQQHAMNVRGSAHRHLRLSRASAKQQVLRIRQLFENLFDEEGISLSPFAVLVSEPTDTRETRYKLKVAAIWRHIAF